MGIAMQRYEVQVYFLSKSDPELCQLVTGAKLMGICSDVLNAEKVLCR